MDQPEDTAAGGIDHDVILIGAGVCGIYQLYRLLGLGLDVTVLEAAEGPGGTWYRNRYPGCRFDSESWTYGYSFSKELLEEWDWSQHFAPQPETLRYLEYVIDKFDLRRHMQLGARVERAAWDEPSRTWTVEVADGRRLRSRFLFTAVGMLSAPTLPEIEGRERFEGPSFHTCDWPAEGVELAGKRVAVIGTGATAVQLIPAIAPEVARLTVFQRRPNWCAPLHNRPIPKEEMARIRASYDDIFARCARTPGAFVHGPLRQRFRDCSPEERRAIWEDLYASPGFGIWLGQFREVLMEDEANAEFSAFIADKIRQRVHDPEVAEKLVPKDHGFGVQRVPMETGYYEAYNRDNVRLVDLGETPIERITATGIETSAGSLEFDVIVYATGFDAITGAFDRMRIEGVGGRTLRDKWADDAVTYLGIQVSGFPNLVILAGPTSASASTNYPRAIEDIVDWASGLMRHARDHGVTRIEALPEAEREWTAHVAELYSGLLLRRARSWFTGYNANVGRTAVRHLIYNGGAPRYRERLAEVAAEGYAGFRME